MSTGYKRKTRITSFGDPRFGWLTIVFGSNYTTTSSADLHPPSVIIRSKLIANLFMWRILYQIPPLPCKRTWLAMLCQSERNFRFCLVGQRQRLGKWLIKVACSSCSYPPRGGSCVYFGKAASGGRPASSNASTPRLRALAARDSRHCPKRAAVQAAFRSLITSPSRPPALRRSHSPRQLCYNTLTAIAPNRNTSVV